jgi:hypothetical protein
MLTVLVSGLTSNPGGAALLCVAASVTLLGTVAYNARASRRRSAAMAVASAPRRKAAGTMTINEKASLLLRNRAYECGITRSAMGATHYEKWCYVEATLSDVSAIFGPDARLLLCRRHFGSDDVERSIPDATMEALASDIGNLASAALVQRSPFPATARSLDERLRPWLGGPQPRA